MRSKSLLPLLALSGGDLLETRTLPNMISRLLQHISECNSGRDIVMRTARDFVVDGVAVGVVLPQAVSLLERFPAFRIGEGFVELVGGGDSIAGRTEALGEVLVQLRAEGSVPMLDGWRSELWPAKVSFHAEPAVLMERAAVPLFGVRGFGCHINGLSGPDHLWVAKRSLRKPTYPGKYDHMVAGGLAHGESPTENVEKECEEEASIPPSVSKRAVSTGIVSYTSLEETGFGLKRDTLFCYDLQVDEGIVPVPNDGEVEAFMRMEIGDVMQSIAEHPEDWKPNVVLVIVDLLIRRGIIKPDDPGYVPLVHSLRQ